MSAESQSADAVTEQQAASSEESPAEAESKAERRTQKRHAFQCIQLLAPYDGKHLPCQADFKHVKCLDLSSSGFSFLTDHHPEFEQVVVALGEIPFKFFVAKIQHTSPISNDGTNQFIVGCRLLNRV